MKKISANILEGKFEHLVDEENLQVTHLQIKKGEFLLSNIRQGFKGGFYETKNNISDANGHYDRRNAYRLRFRQ